MQAKWILGAALGATLLFSIRPGFAADAAATDAGADLYRQWYEVRERDPAAASELAKKYLDAYPHATNADFLRKWVVDSRARRYAAARKSHDIDRMIALTDESQSAGGDRALDFLTFTAFEIRAAELFHQPPVYAHAEAAERYAKAAIEAIEAGHVPPSAKGASWNKETTLALLDQTRALVAEHRGDKDAAIAAYRKAAELEPKNPLHAFALARLYEEQFRTAFDRWRELETGKGASDALAQARAEADRAADRVIEEWTKFLSSAGNRADLAAHRAQVVANLEQVYLFRHPGAETDLHQLIAKYK